MKQIKLKQGGFSLVELAVGLAVVTVLILAVSVSAGIRDNARVQSAASSIQTLRTAAENYLTTGKINYTGLDVSALKTMKLLPDGFTGTGINPWGGDFVITANAGDNTRYDIALGGLSKNDSDKLSAYFTNTANSIEFDDTTKTWTVTF